MGNILSDRTTDRMLNAVNFVEGMAAPVHARSNRRVRTRGGGAERPYLKIKTVTDANNYTADIITPTSATVITAGVTVKALQPTAGASLKVNTELFGDIVDDVYYIQPSVFYGD